LGLARVRNDWSVVCAAAAIFAVAVAAVLFAASGAGAADAGKLEDKLVAAREEASSISASLQASNAELASAQGEAEVAEAHEEELTGLLAEGEERTAKLSAAVTRTGERLEDERARLNRSRDALAARLVGIYESGTPDTADVLLGAGDFEELVNQADYLRRITEFNTALAERVKQVRDEVEHQVERVQELHERSLAYEHRLAAARDEIASVREAAEASAANLEAISAGRSASLEKLKGSIGEWVSEVQEARAAEAAAATEAEAEEEVERWLGGPYSIPTYIVMCESGGNYGAVNPSSGAGGAYQVLPSTWELYGGQGEPQSAPKAEQDRIAGEIWADSGSSAWVCG
jgi:peptidoglycan hydrolase CwlO-like protein